jgi:pimeloyl-ACP methyl ester carboxylesterase
VLVHGIWLPGAAMGLLQHRLHKLGYRTLQFNYPSVHRSLDGNAIDLYRFIRAHHLEQAHIVGHSLGGVVSMRMLATSPPMPPGRVVCLGSPLVGSAAASRLTQFGVGRKMLGKTIREGVIETPADVWARDAVKTREVGIIAGNIPIGLGRILTSFGEPNDGTVAVSETKLPGAKDHLEMAVTHTAMVIKPDVVSQVDAFLQHGEFDR